MVRQRTERGQAGAPDTIDRECCLHQEPGTEWVIMVPGDCDSIEEAEGTSLAAHPTLVADLEAWR